MPHQTRQHIINILEQRRTATAQELSSLLKLTPSNIRYHLSILVDQGSIKVVDYKIHFDRGRPSAIYGLVQEAIKDNLNILIHALLTMTFESTTADKREEILRSLARSVLKEYQSPPLNPTKRLYAAIQILNELNYQARWEAHIDAPRIMFSHCPYLAIIENHDEICQLDELILEELTGIPVIQLAKRTLTPNGHRQCIFRFTKK